MGYSQATVTQAAGSDFPDVEHAPDEGEEYQCGDECQPVVEHALLMHRALCAADKQAGGRRIDPVVGDGDLLAGFDRHLHLLGSAE